MLRALWVVRRVSFLVTSEIASRATLGIGVLLVAGLLEPGVFWQRAVQSSDRRQTPPTPPAALR